MRIRTKLFFTFLASGLFLLLEVVVAAWSLQVVARDVDDLQRSAQADDLSGQVKTELAQLPEPEVLAVEPRARARAALVEHAGRALVLCRMLGRVSTTPSSRRAIERVREVVTAYRRTGWRYARALEAGHTAIAEGVAAQEAFDAVERARTEGAIEPVGHEARLATQAVVRRAETLTYRVTIVGASLTLVSTLIFALVLARITAQPIVRLLRAAREVGRGELTTTVEVRSHDELGELAREFNDMVRRLREVYDGLETEVRKRTDELRQREAALERERRLAAVGRLAAGVAHEVANPLAVIAGAAEGLRDRAVDPTLREVDAFREFPEYLETIESEAYRLKRVVRRLLDFSRTKPTAAVPVDVAEVLRDSVALARLDPRAKQHPVELDAPGELWIQGDPDALKEAVLNLLFNALRAVEAGGDVHVSARADAGQAVVLVRDTGVGISAEDLERIFEPFFTTAPEGTGLGLTLVHGTVERHGGTIRAESEGPGKGATFRVALPLAADAAEGAADSR